MSINPSIPLNHLLNINSLSSTQTQGETTANSNEKALETLPSFLTEDFSIILSSFQTRNFNTNLQQLRNTSDAIRAQVKKVHVKECVIASHDLLEILTLCPRVETLELIKSIEHIETLTQVPLQNLKHLSLMPCEGSRFNENHLCIVLQNASSLETVSLTQCPISAALLQNAPRTLKGLTIALTKISLETLKHIPSYITALTLTRITKVADNQDFTNDDFESILPRLENLKQLQLRQMHRVNEELLSYAPTTLQFILITREILDDISIYFPPISLFS